jgi:hypothetical protein
VKQKPTSRVGHSQQRGSLLGDKAIPPHGGIALGAPTLLPNNRTRSPLMRTLLLWAIGVPLPIIALYWVFG